MVVGLLAEDGGNLLKVVEGRSKKQEERSISFSRSARISNILKVSTTPQHTTPHHTTPHHTTPHYTTPHHTAPHHSTPHHTTPHYTTLHHTTPHHTTLYHLHLNQTDVSEDERSLINSLKKKENVYKRKK